MKFGKKQMGTATTSTDTAGSSAPITRDNWVVRFLSYPKTTRFVARNENARDGQPPTHAQFHAWMIWFAARGILTKPFEASGAVTVPTEWPEDFDRDFYSSDRNWEAPAREVISKEQRGEMVRRLKEFSDALALKSDRRRNNQAEIVETPEQVLARLCASAGVDPDTLPPARKYTGAFR